MLMRYVTQGLFLREMQIFVFPIRKDAWFIFVYTYDFEMSIIFVFLRIIQPPKSQKNKQINSSYS